MKNNDEYIVEYETTKNVYDNVLKREKFSLFLLKNFLK